MPGFDLKPSAVLDVQHFTSFEEFRPTNVIGVARSVPLDCRAFSASRATLALPEALVVLQQSFARHYEADLWADGCGIAVPMSDEYDLHANGRVVDSTTVTLLRGHNPARVFEARPNTYAMLRLHSAMQTRGWADFDEGYEFFKMSPQLVQRLRFVLSNIARSASVCTDPIEFNNGARAMQEVLYEALDAVLVTDAAIRARPRSFDHHRKIVARLEDFVRENPTTVLCSEDLAQHLGTSVRTLQTAMQAVHGMKLHQYLRLKRLWLVRRQLTKALPGVSVKVAARSHGFWHMGEFSRLYKAVFGEMASETLVRARGCTA